MRVIDILFSFEGRIRRSTFWVALIALHCVCTLLWTVVIAQAIGFHYAFDGSFRWSPLWGAPFFWITPLCLLYVWINLAIGWKRCHDRGYPGLMVLISAVPLVGFFWWVIDLGLIDGDPGPNRFGPSPKAFAPMPTATSAPGV